MKLLSVNVSRVKEVPYQGKTVTTGIFKEPLADRVMVRRLNIDGDEQGDRRVHGGFDMAVYAYPIEHYAYWQEELGRDSFPHGQFGENLTVQGLIEGRVRVGDVYRIGGALLQVTQPRIPCYKLAIRMGEGAEFPARFQQSGRPGFYLRVLEEGEIGAGDEIELIDHDEDSVTIAEFIRVYLHEAHDPQSLKRVLASRDLGEAWRVYLEKMLKKAEPVIQARGWEGFRTFVVDRKVPESEIITSFYLRPKDGEPLPAYLPGQFLTFRLNIPGESHPVTRTYTLSDSPKPDYYRVSIKREPARLQGLPPGRSSNYFHDQVEPGSELCVKAPGGQFTLDPEDTSALVLLSGGVGLTPMVSMLNTIVDGGSQRPVWYFHGARNGREHAMGAHVRHLAAEHNNVHAHISYSRPNTEDLAGRDYDSKGYVNVDLLKTLLPEAAYDFYLCGPGSFMKALYTGLLAWGVPQTRIRYEFFGPAMTLKEDTPGKATHSTTDEGWRVSFARSGISANWDVASENILDFAEARGLRPDFSCRTGICHTCMCTLIEGEVDYVTEPSDQPDPGCVLICCSKPRSNVVLDL